ncbi:hypothetical protein ACWT_4918 [Actinoplanes sp. SE50]|uniref:hypothetical protein n=1 Tax=unclassified Actinoplanes TaxID=2626549 RepID=UPI00023EC825|nr:MULTISPECIES: hypothetical protein [unclassified Actinoplanes]AEV85937.1 hypothetical protein ACPL_5048 [Actinoplanes sp. SE50/110]ATO84333.1 hypothetical protein ACWT_4918 [Actinoplanes sp. SE50]SLM01743.1 hypothetical protein ACSP50_4981 [Actinoplanes sp. SE50/110]
MLADALRGLPDGFAGTLALVDGVDDTLTQGLARADPAALEALVPAFAGSPLAERVTEAIGKIVAGTVTDEHLLTLAGARTALLGAAHDALRDSLDTALGRARAPWSATPAATDSGQVLAGARSWLRELAIAGWRGVDHELAGGAGPAVQTLLADPGARRLAVLLDGLAAELRTAAPVATLPRIPVRRWADLWTRALLLAQPGRPAFAATPVDGRLLLLGVDLHEHPTVFQAQAHALLETADGAVRLVRTSVAAAKVDTISGPAAWRMLTAFPTLRRALAEHRVVEVAGMALTPGGDLIWDEARATAGAPADPFAAARVRLGTAAALPVTPLDRHPAALAEPVLLEGYGHTDRAFDLGGGVTLAVDLDRLPAAGPLTPELVAASTACLGLLRWDGRWLLQPLAVQTLVKKKPVAVHGGDWALGPTEAKAAKAEAAAGTAVDVLRERAGRLLRK